MTTTISPVRRSTRARQQVTSAYDEELQGLADKKMEKKETKMEKKKASQESDSEESDSEEVEEEMIDLSDKDDQEDFDPQAAKKQKKSPKKSPPPPKKAKPTIQVKVKARGKTTTTKAKGRRGIHAALTSLSKKALEESETPETSLVAALLASSKPIPGIPSSNPRGSTSASASATLYAPQLEGIARHLLQHHEPNSMHIQLLNLLFRSVGGSVETNLKEGTDLENLDDNEWDHLVTEVVEVMRETDSPLLCANPHDGAREYRAIYQEFWYRLGTVLLTQSQGGGDTTAFSSDRFQVEMVRELVARITELVLVGQPDLRAGATIAVLQLSVACMERTMELEQKLQVANRQYKAASKNQNRKLQTLQHSMDAWKRHKAELEEIVEGPGFQGVFIHRYRDSNSHIRCMSLEALSQLTLLRPDLFLRDKYLKYFGWMASDKVAMVRVRALKGLLAPFQAVAKENDNQTTKRPDSLLIDILGMKNVCTKFLNRIVDCTEDSQSSEVQETAMELLLVMLKEEFLDEWEDDNGWDQVNLKALDKNTTPKVRKGALYFILEQLDSFDTQDDDNKSQSISVSDKKQVERVEGIATWIAHKLCDGPIPIDKIRVHLVDHIIQSLRDMPEHRQLVVNWPAMLKAIRSENPQQGRPAGREEVAKQRVLLRMLACAAELEVGSLSDEDSKTTKKRKRDSSSNQPREALSVALLKSLPHLLTAFKGDVMALRSLSKLPQYLIPAVFSLPARKNDFQSLVKNLCRLFLESTDQQVLQSIALALSILVQGDHARLSEVKMQLKRLSETLQDRLMELFRESDPQTQNSPRKSPIRSSPKRRSTRISDAGSVSSCGMFSISPEVDVENSVHLCLLRWRILFKRCPIIYLFGEATDEEEEEEADDFFTTISEAIGKRLDDRKPIVEEHGDDETDNYTKSVIVPEIWKTEDTAIHPVVANAVNEGLQVLLCVLSWKLAETLESRKKGHSRTDGSNEEDSKLDMELDDDVDVDDLAVARMRKRLVNLLGLCFDQHLEESDDLIYSDEHVEFVSSVQASAGRIASDIRTLFPREWSQAADPVRRQLALTDDAQLIGGFARYLKSRAPELLALADNEDGTDASAIVNNLLMPLARGLTANWNDGNRKEAGIVLAHITGSGQEASHTVQAMARLLKKINPVRFLESQMTCLRLSFEAWVDNEPSELETDQPTEEQINEYEESEKRHAALFHSMEQQASRLSMCLGVGKLTDARLSRAVLSFVQEGVRFAFEGNRTEEDELVLGSRLPFLLVLSKYSNWIKKNKGQLEILKDFLFAKESSLNAHPEFEEVHEDDLAALSTFKASLGIRETIRSAVESTYTQDDYSAAEEHASATPSPSPSTASKGSRRRISTASSQRSRMSTQSALSPLYEEDGAPESEEGDESPSPQKRRRLARSLGSSVTKSTTGKVQSRIDEEDEEQGSASESNES